jgi:alkylation response protein AidB-like acyl-CoA dehydrogenase
MTDSNLTEQEELLATTARKYFADFVDNPYLNEQAASERGYEQARWKQMCDLGWTAINLAEEVGGAGGTLAEAGIVARECGHAAFASPLLPTMRAGTVLTALNAGQQFDGLISRIAEGEPAALVAPPDRTVVAVPDGHEGYRLSGPPALVEWLTEASLVVLAVPVASAGRWLCAVLTPDDLSGRIIPVPSIDNERMARLDLEGFSLARSAVGRADLEPAEAEYALAKANLLRASVMVGGCEAVLDRTAEYAKQRVQFGQPIGAFQAVRHHLARMLIATDAARLACDDALTRAEADTDESAIAAVALFAAGRSYVEVVLTGAQLHGGVGTTTEHILHHHFTRAKAMQLRCGKRASRLREIHAALVRRHEGSLW